MSQTIRTIALCSLVGLLVSLMLFAPKLTQGALIISDVRLTDLRLTPVLGRGYSLATNSYQSECLDAVVVTEPSYDFKYEFTEIMSMAEMSSVLKVAANASAAGQFGPVAFEVEMTSNFENSSKSNKEAKHLMVELNVDTYYASVNEAVTPLAPPAVELLQAMDFPGFFAACGPYYVRGITRNAKFSGLLAWEQEIGESSSKMSMGLQASVKAANYGGGGGMNMTSENSSKNTNSSLKITVKGWGIGKNPGASLISTSVDEFKAAIKEAFISMQNPLTGRATSMELVPWVENLAFQQSAQINGEDVVGGQPVPMFRKKDVLIFNAEFMQEAARAARIRLQRYYWARTCRNNLQDRYYFKGSLGMDFVTTNHRLRQPGILLSELDQALDEKEIQKLFEKGYLPFLMRVEKCIDALMKDPNAGRRRAAQALADVNKEDTPESKEAQAEQEMKKLALDEQGMNTGRGLWLVRWTEHPECRALQKDFVPPYTDGWGLMEDHCQAVQYDGPTQKGAAD